LNEHGIRAKLFSVEHDLHRIGINGVAMPIYEFYCRKCHTVYRFLARSRSTDKAPRCPDCGDGELRKKFSRFAISKGQSKDDDAADPFANVDEAKLEKAFAEMAGQTEGMDEDDPRAMGRMMRKLCESTGMNLGENMEEALRRMEAGEDPDRIDEEMGDLLDDDQISFGESGSKLQRLTRRLRPPRKDDQLYDM
jgi:putative FmdB family regulatory protein